MSATICGQSFALGGPARQHGLADLEPGDFLDDRSVAADDVRRALLYRAETLLPAGARGIADVEADEGRRCVHPAVRLHHVGEDPEDAVRAGRERRRLPLEHVVDVDALELRLSLLELAERVAEPTHHDPAVEADPLDHPAVGDGVAERPQPRVGVDRRLVEDDCALPEAAADDGEAAGLVLPMPSSPSCVSAPPTTTGVPSRKPVSAAASRGDVTDDRSRLDDLREDGAIETADLEHTIGPVALGKVEHPGARAERGVGHENTGELREDPVAEHADVRDRGEHVRLVRARSRGTAPAR